MAKLLLSPKSALIMGASLLVVAATLPVAEADRRNPAPIVFGEADSPQQAQTTTPTPNARTSRVEFRYPDQPDVYYGEDGPRVAQTAADPMAFSSGQSAITQTQARQYAALRPSTNAPLPAVPSALSETRDPALTAGAFDARAAARRARAQAGARPVTQTIRVTAAVPSQAAPTGSPLSLSRVSALEGASLSEETGPASIYVDGFENRPTANGEIFDPTALTAAHPTLPLPSLVQVTNLTNGRETIVRVNDRGPFDGRTIIDLSPRVAEVLGLQRGGRSDVTLRYLGPAPAILVDESRAGNDALRPVRAQGVFAESLAPIKAAALPAPSVPQSAAQKLVEPSLGVPDPDDVRLPTVPKGSGDFYLQTGSFTDIGNAQRLTEALGRRLPVTTEQAEVRGVNYFRVFVGPFPTRSAAATYQAHLKERGIADGFIKRK